MESGKKQIHSKIGEADRHEPQHRDDGDFFPFPPLYKPAMQIKGVEKPCYQGPGFFRVPGPVFPPGLVCPYSAEDQAAKGKNRKADGDTFIGDLIQHLMRDIKADNNLFQYPAESPYEKS